MILCCGEALTDFVPRLTREGAQAFQPLAGGSVFNTAIALGRLGVPSGFFGGLSREDAVDLMRSSARTLLRAALADWETGNRSA